MRSNSIPIAIIEWQQKWRFTLTQPTTCSHSTLLLENTLLVSFHSSLRVLPLFRVRLQYIAHSHVIHLYSEIQQNNVCISNHDYITTLCIIVRLMNSSILNRCICGPR